MLDCLIYVLFFFFFKQKTAYEMRISDWSSDVCSSDLISLSLNLKTANRAIRAAGGGNRGAAAVLRHEMSTIIAALRSADLAPSDWLDPGEQIGRASCRERVCQYV